MLIGIMDKGNIKAEHNETGQDITVEDMWKKERTMEMKNTMFVL